MEMDELTCPCCDGPLLKILGSKPGERLAIYPGMSFDWMHPCSAKIHAEFDRDRRLISASLSFPSTTTYKYVNGIFVREENGS
jgi:hypothetical protein